MATLTISNIEDGTAERPRIRAASRGHSVEEEARLLLQRTVKGLNGPAFWELSRELFEADGISELQLPNLADDRPSVQFPMQPLPLDDLAAFHATMPRLRQPSDVLLREARDAET